MSDLSQCQCNHFEVNHEAVVDGKGFFSGERASCRLCDCEHYESVEEHDEDWR